MNPSTSDMLGNWQKPGIIFPNAHYVNRDKWVKILLEKSLKVIQYVNNSDKQDESM